MDFWPNNYIPNTSKQNSNKYEKSLFLWKAYILPPVQGKWCVFAGGNTEEIYNNTYNTHAERVFGKGEKTSITGCCRAKQRTFGKGRNKKCSSREISFLVRILLQLSFPSRNVFLSSFPPVISSIFHSFSMFFFCLLSRFFFKSFLHPDSLFTSLICLLILKFF